MSAVNEDLVREFFEQQGFLVTQPRRYAVPGRSKTALEEIDLLVFNPRARSAPLQPDMVWSEDDLSQVRMAVVAVRGWHTERFYVQTFTQTPDILKFAEEEPVRAAARMLGGAEGDLVRILCIPRLPASGELKKQTVKALRDKGVHGILSFRTILLNLIRNVDVNKNYEKSDVLQVIRILKSYGLVNDAQLDFFHRRTGQRRGPEAESGEE